MSKKQKQTPPNLVVNTQKLLYNKIETFCESHTRDILLIALALATVLSLLLFDIKLHTGGDDSTYLLQANDFANKGILPIGFKSPGYPMILALFVLFMGFNVIALKFTSVAFFLASIASFFFIFRQKLEPIIFYSTLLFFAINLSVLEYSHQTYSELLFLLVQCWAIYFLWKAEENNETQKFLFITAVFGMAGFYIRAVGGTLPVSILLWFLLQKRWKSAMWFAIFSILCYLPLKVVELAHGTIVIGQATTIFMVNPYNPSLGYETVSGFATRIINNLFLHLNYLFSDAITLPHWEHLSVADGRLLPDIEAFVSTVFSSLILFGCFFAWRRGSKQVAFLAVYFIVYVLFLCFALQSIFPTVRYLVPVVPLLILFFLLGLQWLWHKILSTRFTKTTGFKRGFIFTLALFGISNLAYIKVGIDENLPVLKANLAGNEFYGYTQDWINYLQACRWIKDNLPRNSTGVICRKAELFQIYSEGMNAFGVYSVESTNADIIVAHWKTARMTHLLYDSFQWTSTLRRYVQPVMEKYPRLFEFVHQEGQQVPSYIFKLNYAAIDSTYKNKNNATP